MTSLALLVVLAVMAAPPGVYASRNGEIRISQAGPEKIRFEIETTTLVGENVYICELQGVARYDRTRLAYLWLEPDPEANGDCEAVFSFRKGTLEAEQDGVCGCGAGGVWNGTYKLQVAKTRRN